MAFVLDASVTMAWAFEDERAAECVTHLRDPPMTTLSRRASGGSKCATHLSSMNGAGA